MGILERKSFCLLLSSSTQCFTGRWELDGSCKEDAWRVR